MDLHDLKDYPARITSYNVCYTKLLRALLDRAEREAPLRLTVDVAAGEIRDADGVVARFEIDDFRRTCLMEGLDRIALTLRHEPEIVAYEERRRPDAGRAPGPT